MNLNLYHNISKGKPCPVSIPIRDLMNLNRFRPPIFVPLFYVSIPIRDLMNLNPA